MEGTDSVDLRTTYLGLQLSSPIVASAGPLTRDLAGAKALAAAKVKVRELFGELFELAPVWRLP